MERVKSWFIENLSFVLITIMILLLTIALIAGAILCVDSEKEIRELRKQLTEQKEEYEKVISETVSMEKYYNDTQFLESVILELRYQCPLYCETYNNKDN